MKIGGKRKKGGEKNHGQPKNKVGLKKKQTSLKENKKGRKEGEFSPTNGQIRHLRRIGKEKTRETSFSNGGGSDSHEKHQKSLDVN